jgi:hypothetical protein
MAFANTDMQRYMEEMMRQQRMEQKARSMQNMYQSYNENAFTQSGYGEASAVREPEAPKHLNRKLLLTKGA